MNEEQMRLRYQEALAMRRPATRDACPEPAEIASLAAGDGPEARRLALLDHVMSCAACRREFDLLRAVDEAGEVSGGTQRTHPAGRSFVPTALAASVALAVGAGVVFNMGREESDVFRGGADAAVLLVAPTQGDVIDFPARFTWRTVAGARNYELEILDAGGNVVFDAETADTVHVVAATALLRPGRDYQWWVGVRGADSRLRRSAPTGFRITEE